MSSSASTSAAPSTSTCSSAPICCCPRSSTTSRRSPGRCCAASFRSCARGCAVAFASRARRPRRAARVLAAIDLLERELADGDGDYLVGGRFSVADLTAAALLYPIARPAAFPYPIPEVPATAREFMDSLANRPIGDWVARMYERHRAAPGVRRTLSVGGR
ncbi:MAG TPA: glutathione S-transferase C-terminal domain-containing protein [Solirubrobacteraceae bacterium]